MLEKRARGDVDADVGRLGRQDDRDEQSVGIAVLKLGGRGGVLLGEPAEEFENLVARHRASMTSHIE